MVKDIPLPFVCESSTETGRQIAPACMAPAGCPRRDGVSAELYPFVPIRIPSTTSPKAFSLTLTKPLHLQAESARAQPLIRHRRCCHRVLAQVLHIRSLERDKCLIACSQPRDLIMRPTSSWRQNTEEASSQVIKVQWAFYKEGTRQAQIYIFSHDYERGHIV